MEMDLTQAKTRSEFLQGLVTDALRDDPDFLGRPRIKLEQNVLTYDLEAVPLRLVLSKDDPLAGPLEILIRSAVIRRDLRKLFPGETFWSAPLNDVEARTMSLALRSDSEQTKNSAEETKSLDKDLNTLKDELNRAALQKGWTVETHRGGGDAYDVQIVIDPPGAKLKMMPFLAYRKARFYGTSLDTLWNVYDPGAHRLIGRWRYRVEWTNAQGGPEEDNLSITDNATLTFSPHKGG
jgi:hypothetical protein